MTAIPSPRWVALQLGDLLAGYSGPLTEPHKRALAFAVETIEGDGMGHVADKLQSILDGGRLPDLATAPVPVGHDHPATSHEAAESVTHVAKMERLRIIASIIEDGPASASTIAKRLGLVPNQVSARCNGLRNGSAKEDGGWLEWRDIGFKGETAYVAEMTPAGRRGNVLFLTDSACDELIRQHGSLEVAAKLFREGRTS